MGDKAAAPGRELQGRAIVASAARLDRWGLRESAFLRWFPAPKVAAGLAAAVALGIFVVDTATPTASPLPCST